MILAPLTARTVDVDVVTGEETTRSRLRGFKTVKVFHEGQLVTPPAIGERVLPELLTGENRWQHVWGAVVGRLERDGFTVALHTRSPFEKWNGLTDWSERAVRVADDLQPPQAVKTLLHEWGHIELGHEHRTGLARPIKEVEAESVAYLLAQTIGLDSDAYSVPYIAAWSAGDITVIQQAAEQILVTTKRLVTTLEHELHIELVTDITEHTITTPASNVISITPRLHAVPEPAPELPQATLPLDGIPESPPEPARPGLDDRRFIKAMMNDLEPDQREQLTALVYDPTRADQAAMILADSGKSASQIARLMQRLAFDPTTIRDALLTPTPADPEQTTLFTPDETRDALTAADITIGVDEPGGATVEPADTGARMEDLQLIQRAICQRVEPAKVAALAYGLNLEPDHVIYVCRSVDIQPSAATAIAIALRDGDVRQAFDDLARAWPDIPRGWAHHAHPSLRSIIVDDSSVTVQLDPTRAILDRWTGRTPSTTTLGSDGSLTPDNVRAFRQIHPDPA
jgi:hypothetical protein